MSNILKYLPERSEYSERVAKVLAPYEKNLYAVGSNARKTLYGLKTGVNDYDFGLSTGCGCKTSELYKILGDLLLAEFPNGKVNALDDQFIVDCEVFTLKIRLSSLDEFLFGVRFAGDGLAINVANERPIVLPEYL